MEYLLTLITFIATIAGVVGAFAQFHKWGWHEKFKHLYKLNKWALDKSNDELSFIYNDTKPYIIIIGQRHKKIREHHLNFSLIEMSRFYEFLSPSEIENCESGKKEIPLQAIEKMRDFFSIEKEYIERGTGSIFKEEHFRLIDFIKDGYRPVILCPPRKESHNFEPYKYWSFLFLIKKVNGFEKSFQYGDVMNFYSTGGGKHNVEKLIKALLINNEEPYISILEADADTWTQAKKGDYYLTEEKFYHFPADFENQDTYNWWLKDIEDNLKVRAVLDNNNQNDNSNDDIDDGRGDSPRLLTTYSPPRPSC
ncbi:hypothetical protein [uncultured Thiothrix sp.]|jgi:hypothetical protein|uniref:hypothetical protein n=1 Tax=uncultured Thiothrix sp. TaxID=223185 RepID=UPI00261BC93C|nr:hypothetical protein [uncultured Thiothrix sp.]